MMTFDAVATREGKWWMVSIPAIDGLTQARRLSDAGQMACEYVAAALEVPLEDVGVEVTVDSVGDVDGIVSTLEQIRKERVEAEALEREATIAASNLAKRLALQHVPLRDIGTVLGVSHQRAHQLVNY
ncbi:MAG: HicB family toxin-antitoxin system [Subtercola sp.]|nr:HicB family toxin-antitoxin system [Subtercola sp.]